MANSFSLLTCNQVIIRSIIMRIAIWVVVVCLALATVEAAKKPKGKGKGKVSYKKNIKYNFNKLS